LYQSELSTLKESNDTKGRLLDELGAENIKLRALNDKCQREVTELEESNEVKSRLLDELGADNLKLNDDVGSLNRKLQSAKDDYVACTEKIASLQSDLQHAKAECDDKSLQLASINTKLDELFAEKQELKSDIESLVTSKEDYFEKEKKALHGRLLLMEEENRNLKNEIEEMKAAADSAHNRFQSMEGQLNGKIARLVKDKAKLVSEFNAELMKQEEKYTNVKIELSAWKLEMQNILNRNEMLKKEKFDIEVERDQLKHGITTSRTSIKY